MNPISVLKNSFKVLTSNSSKTAAKALFHLKKAAPTIAVVSGAAGTVVAGVWAVKKSVDDAPDVLEEVAVHLEKARKSESKGAMVKAYGYSFGRIIKLYSGPIVVEILSVTGILVGYKVINGRFAAMSATAAALEELNARMERDHEGYREALKAKFGEDFDKDITWKGEGTRIEHPSPIDPETGEYGEYKIDDSTPLTEGISPYAVIFDEMSTEWSKDPEYNKMTLLRIQQTCNDMLHARGHLFLNDVYKELGIPETRIGQMVGWLDNGDGDGYVDFGMYDVKAVNNRKEFINGYEPSILLDFNVDGVIWDKI